MTKKSTLAVIDGHELTERDFMSSIDNELVTLHDTGDVNRATKLLNMLDSLDTVSGHAKAKFLYGFNEWWGQNKPDENFGDHLESTTSTKAVTAKRYITVWRYVDDYTIPKEIAQRPMRELVPIANTLSQGFSISKDQWRKIGLCSNDRELGDVLRVIKGKQPRKSAKILRLERDGSLYLYKNDVKKFIGFLNIKDAQADKDVAEAIEKIKISAGIIEE
jgi:hypothetical protein